MDKYISTKKAILIILGVILFFIFIACLSVGAFDGNQFSQIILSIFSFIFLFGIFVMFPAFRFSKNIPGRYLLGKPKTVLTIFFTVFWIIVFSTVLIKPEWGWKYANFMSSTVLPTVKAEEVEQIKSRLAMVNKSDGISQEEADLLFRDFKVKMYNTQSQYLIANYIEDKGAYWTAKSHDSYGPGFKTIDTLSIHKQTGIITCTYR